jgi:glutamyl-tRNA synthetase
LEPFWEPAGVDVRGVLATRGKAWVAEAIPLFVERAKTLQELARAMGFLFAPPTSRDPRAEAKFLTPAHLGNLMEVRRIVQEVPTFTSEALEAEVRRQAEATGIKLIDFAQPIRVALTGSTASPPIFQLLALLGREAVLDRLDMVLDPR